MEDSFNARVGKIFGSLNSSSSSSPGPSSLWSLTDDEVERKQWNRRVDEVEVEVEVSDEKKSKSQVKRPEDYNDEEWELKSGIGLDCTLDLEEEEDEYDKVAVGCEERLYMRDTEDYGIDIDSRFEFPGSVAEAAVKDPRANHSAASLRLIEDSDLNPKSILKRKDSHLEESKPSKRVRFDPHCVDHTTATATTTGGATATATGTGGANVDGVPDYMLNPSRYTRYTFDSSSDLCDDSNNQAYMDFLKTVRLEDHHREPATPTFIRRKKPQHVLIAKDATTPVRTQLMPTAADDPDGSSFCAMEEDDQPPSDINKPARQYRFKPSSSESDD